MATSISASPRPSEGMRRRPPGPPACRAAAGRSHTGVRAPIILARVPAGPSRTRPGVGPTAGRPPHPPPRGHRAPRQFRCRPQRAHADSSCAPRASHRIAQGPWAPRCGTATEVNETAANETVPGVQDAVHPDMRCRCRGRTCGARPSLPRRRKASPDKGRSSGSTRRCASSCSITSRRSGRCRPGYALRAARPTPAARPHPSWRTAQRNKSVTSRRQRSLSTARPGRNGSEQAA